MSHQRWGRWRTRAALAVHHVNRVKRTRQRILQIMSSLLNAIETKDWYLRGRSGRVTTGSIAIADAFSTR